MFHTLRKRLTALYTITTGIILTTVIIVVIFSFTREVKSKNLENFQSNLSLIENKLENSSEMEYTWLAEYEEKNNLLIHIEDNAKPLDYEGYGWQSGIRAKLVKQLKKLARADQIDTRQAPISSNKVKSPIYQIKGINHKTYLGAVCMLKVEEGYRSIVLLQYNSLQLDSIKNATMIFLFYALGIVALYLVSWKLVGNALRPVEENRIRQTKFIASASHELRAPLAVIQTSASALKYGKNQETFTRNIEKECGRMSKLIDDMLLLASTDTKNWSIHDKLFDADTLLIETYELLKPVCQEKGYELVLQLPTQPLSKIRGDFDRIKQVLTILIDNAISYANAVKDKRIIIKAYEKRNYIYIQVIDFGIGIEEEKKKYIFERFYRGDDARNEKNHFGLGLSIAKEMIALHGGILSCQDTKETGTTFTIKLIRVN